jgi:septal ring factor EnvC (AmiA/AmiB activator)
MNHSKEARLTVRVNDELHHWVKLFAQRVNKSMSVLVIDHLESLRQGNAPETDAVESESNLTAQLERADSEIQHLREQLTRRDEQIDHLTQLLAMQTKTTAALTEQLDAERQMIEDLRHRSWWKRAFKR